MSRAETYQHRLAFKTLYRIRMSASAKSSYASHLDGDPFGESEVLLLHSDVWEFSGLRELTRSNPACSRVTLYFEADRLRKMEHWTFPFELP